MVLALLRKELPSPPTPSDSGEITDDLWGVLLMCWNFIPEERPDTSELRELLTPPEIRDDRLEAAQSVEASAAFQLQRESSEVIDYVQMEEILLRVSVKLRAPSPIKLFIPSPYAYKDLTVFSSTYSCSGKWLKGST